jgi:acyl dehydratase
MESRFAQYVGRTAPPRTYVVERGHIRRFAEALGDDSPTWSDEHAPAPPTFATCLRANDPRDGLDIDWTRLLHGEQEFSHHRPMFAGDRITVVQRIAECTAKSGKSGDMDLMTLVTEGTDEGGQPVFTARSLVVIRR